MNVTRYSIFPRLILVISIILGITTIISSQALSANRFTIRGELSCGTGDCDLAGYTFYPSSIKGIDIFNFCQNNAFCEVVAELDNGLTITKILSAKKINPTKETPPSMVGKLESCGYVDEDKFVVMFLRTKRYGSISFGKDNLNTNICKKLQVGKTYRIFYSEFEEESPDGPYGSFTEILPN